MVSTVDRIVLSVIIHVTSAFCPPQIDDAYGSGLLWPETKDGGSVHLPCPPSALGHITRECRYEKTKHENEQWDTPDISDCQSFLFISFNQKAESILNEESPHIIEVLEIINELKLLTTNLTTHSMLYPKDLFVASNTLATIASKLENITDISFGIVRFTQDYIWTLDYILDTSTIAVWNLYSDKSKITYHGLQILHSMEELAYNLIDLKITYLKIPEHKWGHLDTITIVSNTIDFFIKALRVDTFPAHQIFATANDSITVSFPKELLIEASSNADNGLLYGLYSTQYSTLKVLLEAEGIVKNSDGHSEFAEITSSILSADFVRIKPGIIENLSDPIIIQYKHKDGVFYNGSAMCAFINESASSSEFRWSDEGCMLAAQNDSHSTCYCYHLTNFALIMDIYKIELPQIHEKALTFISYIGGSFSILGCILSISVYEILRLHTERIRIHEMLALSIIAVQLIFFAGFERTDNKVACKIFAILLHYFLTAMFCWMLVEGIHLYLAVVRVFRTAHSCIKKYFLLGWGLPLLNVFISLAAFYDEYASDSYCWLSTKLLLIGFIPFVAVVVTTNMAILVLVLKVMMRSLYSANITKTKADDLPVLRTTAKATFTLLPLLGVTWLFGFLSVSGTGGTLLFTYIFTIFNSMQGIIFFIFHCFLNVDVQQAIQHKWKKAEFRIQNSSGSDSADKIHSATDKADGSIKSLNHTIISTNDTFSIHPDVMRICIAKRVSAASTDSAISVPAGYFNITLIWKYTCHCVDVFHRRICTLICSIFQNDTNQTLVEDVDLHQDGNKEKSEDEVSEKTLKNRENVQCKELCLDEHVITFKENDPNKKCRISPKSSISLENLKYRGKSTPVEEADTKDIKEALDMLDTVINTEEYYVNYI